MSKDRNRKSESAPDVPAVRTVTPEVVVSGKGPAKVPAPRPDKVAELDKRWQLQRLQNIGKGLNALIAIIKTSGYVIKAGADIKIIDSEKSRIDKEIERLSKEIDRASNEHASEREKREHHMSAVREFVYELLPSYLKALGELSAEQKTQISTQLMEKLLPS